MNKRFLFTIFTILVILIGVGLAVIFVKGYTFSPQQKRLVGTGIITVTSVPDGASVYLNGHLTTATNATLSQLTPKNYSVKISKEGFIDWEKQVEVREGLVSQIKATLFPALPTIYPLTYNGVTNATLSPDGQKLAFSVPLDDDNQLRQKGGVWVWTLVSQPISFARGAQPRQILISTSGLDFAQSTFRWSPDSKQLLVSLPAGQINGVGGSDNNSIQRNYLLSPDQSITLNELRDITPSLEATLKGWGDDQKQKDQARFLTIRDADLQQAATGSAVLRWSPDETKFISGSTQPTFVTPKPAVKVIPTPAPLSGYKVYDLETGQSHILPPALAYFWLPDSLHVILIESDKVSISEYDGSNVAVIYAGKFEDTAIFPWPDSSRLVILTSFPTPTASFPNLFGINLK